YDAASNARSAQAPWLDHAHRGYARGPRARAQDDAAAEGGRHRYGCGHPAATARGRQVLRGQLRPADRHPRAAAEGARPSVIEIRFPGGSHRGSRLDARHGRATSPEGPFGAFASTLARGELTSPEGSLRADLA